MSRTFLNTRPQVAWLAALGLAAGALLSGPTAAQSPATDTTAEATATTAPEGQVDVGSTVPSVASVKEGLFPDDACKELEAQGFKCMGFKPAIKYSLPASSFSLGSAVLPPLLRQQLDVFAEVLRGKKGNGRQVKIIGHADASGSQAGNLALSQRRAESVRKYLVSKGADPAMLMATGVGSAQPKNKANPFAGENRRVEIGRAQPPSK